MAKEFYKTPAFWKEIKAQEKYLKKLNKAIDKKHWKGVKDLIGEGKSKRIRKEDWL